MQKNMIETSEHNLQFEENMPSTMVYVSFYILAIVIDSCKL